MRTLRKPIKPLQIFTFGILFLSYAYPQGVPENFEPSVAAEEKESGNFPNLKYITGYKYLLHEDYAHELPFDTGVQVELGFIELNGSQLLLHKGYGWDGASGPVFDTKTVMRASAVHDALYRLIRYERLSESEFKERCDLEFVRILEEDGMPKMGRYWIHQAVKQFGLKGIREVGIKKVRSTAEKSEGHGIFANIALALKSPKKESKENRPIPSSM